MNKYLLLILTLVISGYSILITLSSPENLSSSTQKAEKDNSILLQPKIGCPGILHRAKGLEIEESYLKLVLQLEHFPFPVNSVKDISQNLDYRIISDSGEKYPLFLSNFIAPSLENKIFTGFLGVASEEAIETGVYDLELINKRENKTLSYQENAVWIEDLTQITNSYSFIVIQDLNFSANSKEAQEFETLLTALETPKKFLARNSFINSRSYLTRVILNKSSTPQMRHESLNITRERIEKAKFVVLLGNSVRCNKGRTGLKGLFSTKKITPYQENFEALIAALGKAKKPFFLVPGEKEAQVIKDKEGKVLFDGLEYFQKNIAPLHYSFTFLNKNLIFFNSYGHPKEERSLDAEKPHHSGGYASKSLASWLKTQTQTKKSSLIFAHHDPRGNSYNSDSAYTSMSLGNLEDWSDKKSRASWMKAKEGDHRKEVLQFLAQQKKSAAFFSSRDRFWQEYVIGGDNFYGWKNLREWQRVQFGSTYGDPFRAGIFTLELYHFLPRYLMQRKLAQLDPQYKAPPEKILGLSLDQIKMGIPELRRINHKSVRNFVQQLEFRVNRLSEAKIRELLFDFQKGHDYFKEKPEFREFGKEVKIARKVLEIQQRGNVVVDSSLTKWQQSNSRYQLDLDEFQEYLEKSTILLQDKFPEERIVQKNDLMIMQAAPFSQADKTSNQFHLVTVSENAYEVQPLKFHLERSIFCYIMLILFLCLELFWLQLTRTFWQGMALGFLETWEDLLGIPSR